MASLSLELSTGDDGTMTLSVDGKSVKNVDTVNVYNWGNLEKPAYQFEITIYDDLSEGVRRVTRLVSRGSEAAKAAIANGTAKTCEIDGFVAIPSLSKTQESLNKFFDKWNS